MDVQLPTSAIKHEYGLNDRAVQRLSFTHGNFMQRFPFPDATFDFVRLSDLALAVPRYAWGSLLTEVHRVLKPSGRIELITDDFFVPRLEFNLESPDSLFNDDAEEGFYKLLASLDIDPIVRDMDYLLHEIFVHGAHEPHPIVKNTVEFRMPLIITSGSNGGRPYGDWFSNSSTSTRWSGSSGACASSYSSNDYISEERHFRTRSSVVADFATMKASDWNSDISDLSFPYYQDHLSHDGAVHPESASAPRSRSSLLPRMSRLNPPGLIVEQTGNSQLPCVRFLPMNLDEVIAHSTKNMHVVLAARESVWEMLRDDRKTEEARRQFLDEFFDFEEHVSFLSLFYTRLTPLDRGMLDRLGLPRRAWYDSHSDTGSFNSPTVPAQVARPTTLLDTSHVFAAPRVTVRRLHLWTARKALEVDADTKHSSKRHGIYGSL
jgi:Methyltransferase domain